MAEMPELVVPNPTELVGKEGTVYQAKSLQDGSEAVLTLVSVTAKPELDARCYEIAFETEGAPLSQAIFHLESQDGDAFDLFLVSRPGADGKTVFEAFFN